LDKTGIIHTIVGKASFDEKQLVENVATLLDAIVRAKPSASKGSYVRSVTLTSTMGPGVKLDPNRIKVTA
jgi:large subunit ribosomal protein L1